jgi:hypothetical protein
MTKSADRLELLKRAVPPTPGIYECTMPGCDTSQTEDGYCPEHPDLPLRLIKSK